MPGQQGLGCHEGSDLSQESPPQFLGPGCQAATLVVVQPKPARPPSCSRRTRFSSRRYSMARCCGWLIHPATAISMNRNGSRVLGVCKVHYPEPRVAMPETAPFQQDRIFGHYATEFLTPQPNRLIRDDDSSFGQKILDISKAQAEAMVKPPAIADDLGRE